MFAWTLPPRYQHSTAGRAALDTLWHYLETYPEIESHHTGLIQTYVKQLPADGSLPEEVPARNENETEITKQPADVIKSRADELTSAETTYHHVSYSPSYDRPNENDDDKQNHPEQQGSRDADGVDQLQQLEETSLSLRELVASFESMTSPYMRAPVVAARRACTSE